jgi:hypothetical protein
MSIESVSWGSVSDKSANGSRPGVNGGKFRSRPNSLPCDSPANWASFVSEPFAELGRLALYSALRGSPDKGRGLSGIAAPDPSPATIPTPRVLAGPEPELMGRLGEVRKGGVTSADPSLGNRLGRLNVREFGRCEGSAGGLVLVGG